MTTPSLDGLRREIDAIDDEIHALIMKRALVVQRIALTREQDDSPPFRPMREAATLRRLAAQHQPPFPLTALVRIWRALLSGSGQMQKPYDIAVYRDAAHFAVWDLARDYLGAAARLTAHSASREALRLLFEGKVGLAVLPAPLDGEDAPWWPKLRSADAPAVLMRLPVIGCDGSGGDAAAAFVVGRIPAENADTAAAMVSLLTVTADPAISRDGIRRLLTESGLTPTAVHVDKSDAAALYLFEIAEFLSADDPRLRQLTESAKLTAPKIIGSYPAPWGGDRQEG